MNKRKLYVLVFLFLPLALLGQTMQLAKQYYKNGEYEKAASMLEDLRQKHPSNTAYVVFYADCLVQMKESTKAIKLLKGSLQKKPDPQLHLNLAYIYEGIGEETKSKEQYQKAIQTISGNRSQIIKVARELKNNGKNKYAIQAYEQGAKSLQQPNIFAFDLALLYKKEGEIENMVEWFLRAIETSPARVGNIKRYFQRYLETEEDYIILQRQIFAKIRAGNTSDYLPDLLAWAYIQNKDYQNALRQVRAIDMRKKENGRRVYELAQIAENDASFDIAIQAYTYILNQKVVGSPYYLAAQQQILNCKRKKIIYKGTYDQTELTALYNAYDTFLVENGKRGATANIMADQAELAALYLNDTKSAISILQELIDIQGVNPLVKARAKLDLADYYLVAGKRWDATLLYAQVDKSFPEGEIGELARFKNAMLSFYSGDFEWAQEQFDILKAATTRLIANDAIDRSVFIMDNLNLDTTPRPLMLYAKAELFAFQNQFDDAFRTFDTILNEYADHGLHDDILYAKGLIAKKRRKFEQAIDYFSTVYQDYPDDIRADNALYEWAKLEETYRENLDKAKELYEALFLEYPFSTYVESARESFRRLRGDAIP